MVERLRERKVSAWAMAAAVLAAVAVVVAMMFVGGDSPHAAAAAGTPPALSALPASLVALTQQPQSPASMKPAPRPKVKHTQRRHTRHRHVKRTTHHTARHVAGVRVAAVPSATPAPMVVAAHRAAPVAVPRAVVPAPTARALPRGESSAWSGDFRP